MKIRATVSILVFCLTLMAAGSLSAQDKGTVLLKIGVHNVDPKSDNGSLAGGALTTKVDDNLRPTVMVEYFVASNLGIEVLASWPFSHDISLNGADAGSVDHLPPTISLQYHFNSAGQVSPYLGVGINYTLFFSEDPAGPIAGTDLELDPSFGLAAHAGLDFKVNDKWSIGVDARWLDIDTDVAVNGNNVGTVEIDPLAYGVYAQMRF